MSASRWSCPGTRELGVIRRNVIRRNPRCVGLRLENTMMVPAEDRQPNIFSKILKIDSDPHPHMRKHSVVPCARRQSSTKKSTQSPPRNMMQNESHNDDTHRVAARTRPRTDAHDDVVKPASHPARHTHGHMLRLAHHDSVQSSSSRHGQKGAV